MNKKLIFGVVMISLFVLLSGCGKGNVLPSAVDFTERDKAIVSSDINGAEVYYSSKADSIDYSVYELEVVQAKLKDGTEGGGWIFSFRIEQKLYYGVYAQDTNGVINLLKINSDNIHIIEDAPANRAWVIITEMSSNTKYILHVPAGTISHAISLDM
jgi:hypothetical protein